MWITYEVKMKFVERLCGSTPINPELITGWLEARKPRVRPPGSKTIEEVAEEVMTTIATENGNRESEEIEQKVTLGFQSVDNRLVMRGGTLKAHIKDCGRILSSLYIGKIEGQRSLAVRLINCANVDNYWVPIHKDGEIVKEADGFFDKAVHVQTPRGPRNALKRILYVEKPSLTFDLMVMENQAKKPVVALKDLESLFQYGGKHGYAGERGDGEGRYTFTIKEKK